MIQATIKSTIEQADDFYEAAQREMYKPEEDVVNYMVCSHAYKAIKKYLVGFVLSHGKDIEESISIESLVDQCNKLDKRFKKLDLSPLYNSASNEHVWMDFKTAHKFMELATKTKELIR